ncbi:MAG: hypothetical protein ACE5OZ_15250 [Candidatus Heimdallarchaeota archaeon]
MREAKLSLTMEPILEERPVERAGEPPEEYSEEPNDKEPNQLFLDEKSKTKEESDTSEEDSRS